MSLFDDALGPQINTLQLRSQRSVVLANNIANAETPHFKARDMDFKAILNGRTAQLAISQTHSAHQTITDASQPELGYRIPTQASSDNNTVEVHVEKAQFAENAQRYVADLSFIKNRVQGLIRAMGRE